MDSTVGRLVGTRVGDRYLVLQTLSDAGGMGEVYRAKDEVLNRSVAIKVARPEVLEVDWRADRRFKAEVELTAALDHTNIVEVYDAGFLPAGDMWFAMREVSGRSFDTVFHDLARGVESLDNVVQWLASAARAVHYAHEQGVVHRDLKPQNLMVDHNGRACVIDWGIARILGNRLARPQYLPTSAPGAVGTADWRAPELRDGGEATPAADIYGLALLLREALAHAPEGEPDAPYAGLWALVAHGTQPSPGARPASAAVVAERLDAWQVEAKRTEEARTLIERATASVAAARRLDEAASDMLQAFRESSRDLDLQVPNDVSRFRALFGDAMDTQREAAAHRDRADPALQSALWVAPGYVPAHALRVDVDLEGHERAVAQGRPHEAQRLLERIRRHLDFLPEVHPIGVLGRALVAGEGRLQLATVPAGATVTLITLNHRDGRYRTVVEESLGAAPIDVRVPTGHYLCRVCSPGRSTVDVPVWVRGGAYDAPPVEVVLPPADRLGPHDRVVTGGWFWSGGDEWAWSPLPRRWLWIDGFVMQRDPVTHARYLEFLADLAAQGRHDEVEAHVPRLPGTPGRPGAPFYARDPDLGFVLPSSVAGQRTIHRDEPVCYVSWFAARAFAAWESSRTGMSWRLPSELEWEKAARGVDGRIFPWGDIIDPSDCHMVESHPDLAQPGPVRVSAESGDVSPYGIRGLAGNVNDWCADRFHQLAGPPVDADGHVLVEPIPADHLGLRSVRGSSWNGGRRDVRVCARGGLLPGRTHQDLGVRLVRSLEASDRR